MTTPSVLLIGATGRLGHRVIQHAASSSTTSIPVHAFCRTPSKLPSEDASLCASIVRGDARLSDDLRRALTSTNASVVLMIIGDGDSTARTDLREASARALMDVIAPGTNLDHIKVVVLSSTGAGGTKMDIGFGAGKILELYLRHVMKDHDNQEAQFKSRIGDQSRLLIVRPTALTDQKPTGHTTVFKKDTKAPSIRIDREDLAKWIVAQIGKGSKGFGREVSITGAKK